MGNWTRRQAQVTDLTRIDATLRAWEPVGGCCGEVQAGDVGWMLRFGPEHVAESLVEFVADDGQTGAILLRDNPGVWLFQVEPAHAHDRSLSHAMAAYLKSLGTPGSCSVDGPNVPSVWRQVFVENGFEATTDAWAHLWKPLGAHDMVDMPGVFAVTTERDIADRVAVQRSAFVGSTFTVDRWHEMAKGPSYRSEFDLLARDEEGTAVAALTVWLAGAGKCGIVEPMGTHADHRRQGHGTRLIRAAMAALARAGASSVSVVTPESNSGAVAAYQAAGFRRIGLISGMVARQLTTPLVG